MADDLLDDSYNSRPVRRPRRSTHAPTRLPGDNPLVVSIPQETDKEPGAALKTGAAKKPEAAQKPTSVRDHVLPTGPEGESAAAWGDSGDDNGDRLLREVPPHWGR